MILPSKKIAVITAHPPHGLRIFGFLQVHRPLVYVLTDGSGCRDISRKEEAAVYLQNCGARPSTIFCRFSDAEFFDVIRRQDVSTLLSLCDEIVEDLDRNAIDVVVGDAAEGFSPAHDICRYLINTVVAIYGRRRGKTIPNYDFLLDGPPDKRGAVEGSMLIELDAEGFERKMAAIKSYPGIEIDVEQAFSRYGETSFGTECIRPVRSPHAYDPWTTARPGYEAYGAEKVKEGVYDAVISFAEHIHPLARHLSDHANL